MTKPQRTYATRAEAEQNEPIPGWFIAIMVVVAVLAITVLLAACGEDKPKPGPGVNAQVCDKACQRKNDVYLNEYTDYFVNDSDGAKDSVFSVYHGVKFGDQTCDVIKSFDSEGVGLAVVCPDGVHNGSSGGQKAPEG